MRDCENCEKYVKSENGNYACSSWECVQEESDPFSEKLKCIAEIPNDEKYWEKKYTSQCTCGGTMISMRVRPNGHLRAKCMKCGWRIIE